MQAGEAGTRWNELGRRVQAFVVVVFLVALGCRGIIFEIPHREGDEVIYTALVEQLEAGNGYTLRGHPILRKRWIVVEQYGEPLFYHPPGAPFLFWQFRGIFGGFGMAATQIACFALFFWSVLALGLQMLPRRGVAAGIAVLALVAGFTPIMTSVVSRYWLDGPLLAFTALGTALFVAGVRKGHRGLWIGAGVALGYASLVKLTAFLALPGILLVAFTCRGEQTRSPRAFAVASLWFLAVAALVQLPWEIWQWSVMGSPFPRWAGRPSPRLVAINRYVNFVTVGRSHWVYLELLPQILWTMVPALLLWAAQWRDRLVRERGLALVFWVAVVVGVHVALGAAGYSKVIRYVVLVTPATVLLIGLVVAGAAARLIELGPGRERVVLCALLAIAGVGVALEVAQGIKTPFYDGIVIAPLLR